MLLLLLLLLLLLFLLLFNSNIKYKLLNFRRIFHLTLKLEDFE